MIEYFFRDEKEWKIQLTKSCQSACVLKVQSFSCRTETEQWSWSLVPPTQMGVPEIMRTLLFLYVFFFSKNIHSRTGFLHVSVTLGLSAFQDGLKLEVIPLCHDKAVIRQVFHYVSSDIHPSPCPLQYRTWLSTWTTLTLLWESLQKRRIC